VQYCDAESKIDGSFHRSIKIGEQTLLVELKQ
jgi:hypothetical protein